MTNKQAIEIIKHHNMWRRGEIDDHIYSPTEIGIALDILIKIAECVAI